MTIRVSTAGGWLHARRAVAWRRILLAVTVLTLAGWLLASSGGVDPAGRPLGTDFLSFWAAAQLALDTDPAAAWNVAAHWAVQRAAFGPDVPYAAFFYPPPFLLVLLPLGALPYFPALLLWLGVTCSAYVAVCRRWLGRQPDAAATALAFPPVLLNIGHGQNGLLTAALLGGGLAAMRGRRPWLAGLLMGALVAKPHLALLLPPALALRGEWRVAIVTGMAACGWCGLSVMILGFGAWGAFLADTGLARAVLEQGLVEPGKMVSAFAATRVLGGTVALAYGIQALVALSALGMLALLARRRVNPTAQDAALIAATLLASPFLLDYDLALMALPLAWLLRDGIEHGFAPRQREAMALLFATPLILRPLALALSLPLAPFATGALLALVARAALRSSPCRR